MLRPCHRFLVLTKRNATELSVVNQSLCNMRTRVGESDPGYELLTQEEWDQIRADDEVIPLPHELKKAAFEITQKQQSLFAVIRKHAQANTDVFTCVADLALMGITQTSQVIDAVYYLFADYRLCQIPFESALNGCESTPVQAYLYGDWIKWRDGQAVSTDPIEAIRNSLTDAKMLYKEEMALDPSQRDTSAIIKYMGLVDKLSRTLATLIPPKVEDHLPPHIRFDDGSGDEVVTITQLNEVSNVDDKKSGQ